ncbi:hypothetical protein [Pedobacter psychrodurus]|uniref:hypothetical protein n=1 Tax=Pedobacter psychrodurus TaxID=2530456 RepID=UPI0029306A68|nr:hypothetical protein [Pedobacter psychrodurus]
MSTDKLEFKITKDAKGNDIEFDNLTTDSANSLILILQSMRDILSITPGAGNLKIQLVRGSVGVQVPGPAEVIEHFHSDFENVLDKKETNGEIVAPWRQLQNLFQANGLSYEANFHTRKQKFQVVDQIKKAKEFRARPVKRYARYSLEILKGKLIEVGGKNPNVHLLHKDVKIPIRCSEKQAILVNKYLYQEIEILTRKKSFDDNDEYTFCEFFPIAEQLELFKDLLTLQKNNSLDDFLFKLHFFIKDIIMKNDFNSLKKLLEIYDHDSSEVNILKTILVITKSFTEHPELKEQRAKLYHTLSGKLDAEK